MDKKLMDAGGNLELSVTGSVTIVSIPSIKNKAGGQGLFFEKIDFVIPPGATNGTCTSNAPFNGSITATASKVQDGSGKKAVLDGDNVNVVIPGVLPNTNPCTINATVTAKAGQTKVKGK